MDFQSNPPERVAPISDIVDALGIDNWVDFQYSPGNQKLLVHLETHEDLQSIEPDFRALGDAENPYGWRAVMITSPGFDDYDFTSRHFAPLMGVNEDPVTGSNHTVLAPYWGEILDKSRNRAYQASKRRGSLIVENFEDRVPIIGRSVLVVEGKIRY